MDPRLAAHLELQALAGEELIRRIYATALRREPDHAGLERALARLADGSLSPASLLRELVSSDEFARLSALDDAVAEAAGARSRGAPLRGIQAPPGDERPVEIAWTLARVPPGARVLDVGYAFAEPAYLAGLLGAGAAELCGVDLAEQDVPGMRTVRADVRRLPYADKSFDRVLCISTLEHVGGDNERYGVTEAETGGIESALAELRRVLARNGRLIVTVPTGAREDHGWFVQLEPAEWRRHFAAAGLRVDEEELYALGADGWHGIEDVGAVPYGANGAAAILCASLRRRRFLGFG